MRVAVTTAPGHIDVNIDGIEPSASAGEVVVAVESVGICGSDVHAWTGDHPYLQYPGVQGHEFGGRVLAIGGSGPVPFEIGERVAVEPLRPCGRCLPCRRGMSNCCVRLEVMGAHIPGALAERVVVPASSCYRVGDLDRSLTALVEPMSIGCQAVARAGVARGDQVMVLGAGPIGQAVLLAALDRGASVLVVDRIRSRLDLADGFGADVVVDAATEDLRTQVDAWTGHDGPVTVIEATGAAALVRTAFDLVAPSGTVVIVGLSQDEVTFPMLDFTRRELTVMGSRNNAGLFGDAVDLVRRRRADLHRLISHRFPLEQVADALELAHGRRSDVMKILIDVDPA